MSDIVDQITEQEHIADLAEMVDFIELYNTKKIDLIDTADRLCNIGNGERGAHDILDYYIENPEDVPEPISALVLKGYAEELHELIMRQYQEPLLS
jgi:gamma-glutamyltranspeptidase